MAAGLPKDDDITSFVEDYIRRDYRKNGSVTATVRTIRAAIADHFDVDDDALKEHKRDLIKTVAQDAVEAVEKQQEDAPDESKDADEDEEEFSSLDDSDAPGPSSSKQRQPKKTTKKRTPKAGSSKKATSSSTSPDDPLQDEIARLKKYIVACGSRKVWSKWFSSLDPPAETPKAQAKALRQLLADLGMEGRLSMEKAKKIKEKRDFEEEMRAIGADALPSNDGAGRSTRNKRASTGSKKASHDDDSEGEGEQGSDEEGPKPAKKVSRPARPAQRLARTPAHAPLPPPVEEVQRVPGRLCRRAQL